MKFILQISVFIFASILTAQVKTGIDVLKESNFKILEGKKVGLITNPTGVDKNLKSTVDIFYEAENVNLTALYGPEHGVRGDHAAGEYVDFYIDEKTNVPVYSLYGKTRKPSKEMIENVDALVYDIQDIGSRSYTYISTMGLAMETAAEYNLEFVVLDRPNPIGGDRVEGPLVEDGFYSFVSQFKIPYVYGLTCGEVAELINNEKMLKDGVKCNLTVIKMEGWNRNMTFEETGLEWVPTSPHIPHKNSAYYYSTSGIVGELGTVSIGVGYTLPFQTFAANWINGAKLTEKMNSFNLPGVEFRPITYKPFYAMGKGEYLHGVQIHIIDFTKVKLTEIQFYFLEAVKEIHPDKDIFEMAEPNRISMFDKVAGTDKIRKAFTENWKFDDIKEAFYSDAEKFKEFSKKYYLYE